MNAGEKSLNFTNLLSSWYVLGPAMGLPGGSAGKEFACNAGDLGLIPGLGRFWPGEFHGLYSLRGCKEPTLKDAFKGNMHA